MLKLGYKKSVRAKGYIWNSIKRQVIKGPKTAYSLINSPE